MLGNFVGFTAAFLLIASCGADVYKEFLTEFHNRTVAGAAAFIVPLILFWIAVQRANPSSRASFARREAHSIVNQRRDFTPALR
jgi:hypothetical protein